MHNKAIALLTEADLGIEKSRRASSHAIEYHGAGDRNGVGCSATVRLQKEANGAAAQQRRVRHTSWVSPRSQKGPAHSK
jgi:hypothetical protein